jgi:bifunctional non-homologous end joining protein LigD
MTTTTTTAPTSAEGLAQNAEKPKPGITLAKFSGSRYIGEPKWDGWRLLVHRHENGVSLYTRTGKSHDGSLPEIEAELAANLPVGTWLDTEAVAMTMQDGKIVHHWNAVQSVLGSGTGKAAAQSHLITLVAFDLIAHGNIDARGLSFAKRRELLEGVMGGVEWKRVILSPQVTPTDDTVDALLSQGFEGMVIKDREARYASGKRGKGWTKIKPQDTEDVVVMGFKPGENGFAGMVGAVIFGQYKDGELVERGRCSGMDMKTREHMTANPDAWIGTVIEVAHMGVMESGSWRHPQMKRKRDDKPATACEWT